MGRFPGSKDDEGGKETQSCLNEYYLEFSVTFVCFPYLLLRTSLFDKYNFILYVFSFG